LKFFEQFEQRFLGVIMYTIIFFERWLIDHKSFSTTTLPAYTNGTLWARIKYKGFFVCLNLAARGGVLAMSDLRDRRNCAPPPKEIRDELRDLLLAEVNKRNVLPLAAK